MSQSVVGLSVVVVVLLTACAGSRGAGEPTAVDLNEQAEASCDAGDASACHMLGMSLFVEARAKRTSAAPSLGPFQRACEDDEWLGCAMAVAVMGEEKQDPRDMAMRAFSLAEEACKGDHGQGGAGACIYLGDWATQAGDRAGALSHFRSACLQSLRVSGPEAIDEYSCLEAVELGASASELAAEVKPPGADFEPARRISGETQIHPSKGERAKLCELRMEKMKAQAVLCLSDTGLPRKVYFTQYSGARSWDRRLFEAMRSWRYTPFINADGIAAPACTEVTFVFSPRC